MLYGDMVGYQRLGGSCSKKINVETNMKIIEVIKI